jgi:hypothetical protein
MTKMRVDIEPGTGFDTDPALLALVATQRNWSTSPTRSLALIDALTPLIKKGANPVVFCRYLATAEHVAMACGRHFPSWRRSCNGRSDARRAP